MGWTTAHFWPEVETVMLYGSVAPCPDEHLEHQLNTQPSTTHPLRRPPVSSMPAVSERPRLGTRILGWTLMTMSLGLVSCQSLFVL
jgi:hypothetical protein